MGWRKKNPDANDVGDFCIGVIVRRVNNLQDVQIVLNGLLNDKAQAVTSAQNSRGRQIKNTGAGTEPDDVVVVAQLHSAIQAAQTPPPSPPVQQVAATVSTNFEAEAIFPGVQVVANDVLANRYTVAMPLDANNNPLFTKITLQSVTMTAKILPISNYTLSLSVSLDSGVTWNTIFGAGGVTLPGGQGKIKLTPSFVIPTLTDGNEIRADILAADGIVSGGYLLLQGIFS